MKSVGNNVSSVFVIVLIAVILLVVVGCVFGFYCFGNKKENFENGCAKEVNFQDPNFANERFFHYDNIDNLISSDPVHVPRDVLQKALLSKDEIDNEFGDAKKKRQS